MPNRATVVALAGLKSSGEPVMEELLVDVLEAGYWRLVASPGLILGIAAGDTFRLNAAVRRSSSREAETSPFRSMDLTMLSTG
jgi:hypothetical protein